MPFVLITIGVVLFVTALNGTTKAFGSQIYKDLFTNTGGPSFIYWMLALVVVGMIGYIPEAKKPSDAFMALIIIGMVLANGGFFQKLQQAIAGGPSAQSSANPLQAVAIGASVSQPAVATAAALLPSVVSNAVL
jgi:hypothetical protein